jgi:hypothetical protein
MDMGVITSVLICLNNTFETKNTSLNGMSDHERDVLTLVMTLTMLFDKPDKFHWLESF